MIRLSFRFLLMLLGLLALAVAASADSVSVTMQCFTGFLMPYSQMASASGSIPGGPEIPGYPQITDEFQSNVQWIFFISPESFTMSSYDGKLTLSGRTTSYVFTPLVFSRGAVGFTTATDSLVWSDYFGTGERIELPQTGAPGGGGIQIFYGDGASGSIQVGFDVPSTPVPEPEALTLLSLGLLLGVVPRLLRRA